ncbi:uncharacterized protein [Tiliqua scincoides]|uniref:uncharacterized protein n=1 Tax=Tiliqua scincoides TaxID=71010 RepID=UPI003462BD84
MPPVPPLPNCPPGLEYLSQLDQILIIQQIEIFEILTNIEVNNRYAIKNALGQMIYFAAEENDCCTLFCCGGCRPFTMKLFSHMGQQVIELVRPWKCWCCWCCCCLQELEVQAPPGIPIGYVKQIWGPCVPVYVLQNEAREDVFKITGPFVGCGCCKDIQFNVIPVDGVQTVGKIIKNCGGCVKECFTDADNFTVQFPMNLDVKMKAVMIGACFLIDFMFFEDSEPMFLYSDAPRCKKSLKPSKPQGGTHTAKPKRSPVAAMGHGGFELSSSEEHSSREEGELSGEDQGDANSNVNHLFPAEFLPRVLEKVIRALSLNASTDVESGSAALSSTSGRPLFPQGPLRQAEIPFPEAFLKVMESEWTTPLHGKRDARLVNKFYSLLKEVLDKIRIPSVDAQMAALATNTIIPSEGEGGPRDPLDKRIEAAFKRAFEASSFSLQAAAANSIFARATFLWID